MTVMTEIHVPLQMYQNKPKQKVYTVSHNLLINLSTITFFTSNGLVLSYFRFQSQLREVHYE